MEERNEIAAFSYPYKVKRDLIWGFLNQRLPTPVSDRFLELQDKLFWAETIENGIIDSNDFHFKNGISLWQGDITRLRVDAVVNAANNSLLGCFIPHHKCIDNVIHSRAGVQVRLDCSKIMGAQGEAEPSGCAKITLAYNLPSKYIIHTVGPIYSGTAEDAAQLADCYRNSLNLAKEHDVHSIAFPAISTGVYGYPLDAATQIAVDTVTDWLQSHVDYDMRVIFCCFDARTAQVYQTKMKME